MPPTSIVVAVTPGRPLALLLCAPTGLAATARLSAAATTATVIARTDLFQRIGTPPSRPTIPGTLATSPPDAYVRSGWLAGTGGGRAAAAGQPVVGVRRRTRRARYRRERSEDHGAYGAIVTPARLSSTAS